MIRFAKRYRKIVGGVVLHAIGGAISSNPNFNSGMAFINAYFGTSKISLASDGNGDVYVGANNGVFKTTKSEFNGRPYLIQRLAGGEAGAYGDGVNGLNARFGSDLKIVVGTNEVFIADKEVSC